jgi:hypothetical protein
LTEVEHIFHEKTVTISDGIRDMASALRFDNSPSIASVGTSVPEQHPSVSTALEHLESDKMPSAAKTPGGLPIAPTVQAIIVDCVPVANPEFAAIIGNNAKSVIGSPEDSQATCPTHGEVIAST